MNTTCPHCESKDVRIPRTALHTRRCGSCNETWSVKDIDLSEFDAKSIEIAIGLFEPEDELHSKRLEQVLIRAGYREEPAPEPEVVELVPVEAAPRYPKWLEDRPDDPPAPAPESDDSWLNKDEPKAEASPA